MLYTLYIYLHYNEGVSSKGNKQQMYCVAERARHYPLSDTTCSGSPCLANICRRASMVFPADVDDISTTSGHFEWPSTVTRNIRPRKGPAISMWRRCQGRAGHIHGCSGATAGDCLALLAKPCQLLKVLVKTGLPEVTSGKGLHPGTPRMVSMEFL